MNADGNDDDGESGAGTVHPHRNEEVLLDEKNPLLTTKDTNPAGSGISAVEAGVILGKCCVGLGWLSVSTGLNQMHIPGGIFCGLMLIAMNAFGMCCLASLFLDAERTNDSAKLRGQRLTYDVLAGEVLGNWLSDIILMCIVGGSIGGAAVTTIFLSSTGQNLVPVVPRWGWVLILLVPSLAMAQLRELKVLGSFALGALGCVFVSMNYISIHCGVKLAHSGVAQSVHGSIDMLSLPAFFGVFFYALDYSLAVGPVVLDLHPDSKKHANKLVTTVTTCAGLTYLLVGLLGCLAYGDSVEDPISANLPKDTANEVLVVILALSALFSLPLSLFPVSQILDNKFPRHPVHIRLAVVLVPMLGSMGISSMTDAMGLCTGLLGVLFNSILPAVMYWCRFRDELSCIYRFGLATLMLVATVLGISCFVNAFVSIL